MSVRTDLKAILWDFGGVITTSPFEAFARYEVEMNIPRDLIRNVNGVNPQTNAWARFESNQIDLDAFDQEFRQETRAAGHEVSGRAVIGLLSGDVRPKMIAALRVCKAHFKVGCLTNNVRAGLDAGMSASNARAEAVAEAMALFDVVIESSREGVRKPQPAFYVRALEALNVKAEESLFMDDLGMNLKPAKAMGMETIKVVTEEQILRDLSAATGLNFN